MVLPLLQYILAAALLAFVLFPLHKRFTQFTVEIGWHTVSVDPRLSAVGLTALAAITAVVPLLVFSIGIL